MKSLWRQVYIVVSMIVLVAPRLHAQVRHEFSELHMGVEVRIVLYAVDESKARNSARAAFDRVAQLEDKMSDYRPKSEVRLLEDHPGEWQPVSEDLFQVLSCAVEVATATHGAFDPTVGPLVALWREARQSQRLPNDVMLRAARARTGWRNISLDTVRRRVRLQKSGMRIDLGGIAKGYIVQQALFRLREIGVTQALVEAGGDIGVSDAPPGQPGWRVEVPTTDSIVRAKALALKNVVISTSGPDYQFVDIGGKRYSHVVDPRTGIGLTSNRNATVIAKDGAVSDALSTALTILGAEDINRVLAKYSGVTASVSP